MKKKKNSYSDWWLHKDMENMGFFFEYCDLYCKELYNVQIDKLKFVEAFMNSGLREETETGNPRMLAQSAYDDVEVFVDVDCNNDLSKFTVKGEPERFIKDQLYWVGWMYAYLHYEEDILSKDLIKILPLKDMLQYYYAGHQMSKEGFYENIKDVFKKGKKSV